MTATILPPEVLETMKPETVAPFVAYLAHESCEENGSLIETVSGYATKQRW